VTQLVWQGCSADRSGSQCATVTGSGEYAWPDALAYCDDLRWGGYDDWHLPDVYELQSILDDGLRVGPTIDAIAFPGTSAEEFLSSSISIGGGLYCANFGAGGIDWWSGIWSSGGVRCVRSAARGVPKRFTRSASVAGEPVVADQITGLLWQGCSAGRSGDSCALGMDSQGEWKDALAYCLASDWGGYHDWRLPNIRELWSIERDVEPLRTDSDAFPKTPMMLFWSSTTGATDGGNAYMVTFSSAVGGGRDAGLKASTACVRCVRGEP
jgi:hypothetical protein